MFRPFLPNSPFDFSKILENMDFASIKDQLSNLSLYDVKAAVRKAQNGTVWLNRNVEKGRANVLVLVVVMNFTDMEAKVRVISR